MSEPTKPTDDTEDDSRALRLDALVGGSLERGGQLGNAKSSDEQLGGAAPPSPPSALSDDARRQLAERLRRLSPEQRRRLSDVLLKRRFDRLESLASDKDASSRGREGDVQAEIAAYDGHIEATDDAPDEAYNVYLDEG
jgi:hypothetical protein